MDLFSKKRTDTTEAVMAVVAMLVHVQSFPLYTLLTIWYFSLSENSLNAPTPTNIHERITHHSVYHEINSRIQCLIERLRKLRTKDRERKGDKIRTEGK